MNMQHFVFKRYIQICTYYNRSLSDNELKCIRYAKCNNEVNYLDEVVLWHTYYYIFYFLG